MVTCVCKLYLNPTFYIYCEQASDNAEDYDAEKDEHGNRISVNDIKCVSCINAAIVTQE